MSQKLAIVVTTADDPDATAAFSIATRLGYRVRAPRRPSIHLISRDVPDMIVVDWAPWDISENTALLNDIRSTTVLREVPVVILYSDDTDVAKAVLSMHRLAAIYMPSPMTRILRALETIGIGVPDDSPASSQAREHSSGREEVWALIHPSVVDAAKSRFDSGHFADAAEAALKAVNARVKRLWIATGRQEKDGKALMLAAFSPNAPAVRLDDLSTESGRNVQEGYMHLCAGAIQAIRNPKVHDVVTIGPDRALHFLIVASLIMFTLDDAGAA